MVMRNAMLGYSPQWLELENYNGYAHKLLIGAFVFSDTPEGADFWYNLRDKLEAKNL